MVLGYMFQHYTSLLYTGWNVTTAQNESVNTLDLDVQKVSNKFFSDVHSSRGN